MTITYLNTKQTFQLTCPEVDNKIGEEDSIRNRVEDDPRGAEFVVEEGDDDWQNDEVRYQQHQHRHVPVKPAH